MLINPFTIAIMNNNRYYQLQYKSSKIIIWSDKQLNNKISIPVAKMKIKPIWKINSKIELVILYGGYRGIHVS